MKPTVSLTFDDGLACQRLYAIPELDKRGLRGTFFLIVNSAINAGDFVPYWNYVAKRGHEIGNHSFNHYKAATLGPQQMNGETTNAKTTLEKQLGVRISSYCYPYTDAPAALQQAVAVSHKQARGGRVARLDKFLVPGDGVNLYNVPAIHVGPETIDDAPKFIAEAVRRKAWLSLMLHGVGPDDTQWDNISTERFATLLDMLVAEPQLQVLPFNEAADAYRRG
jgi:peptidoglycan/xylan/chitin deacetylase (PgdA/CDA1 family)